MINCLKCGISQEDAGHDLLEWDGAAPMCNNCINEITSAENNDEPCPACGGMTAGYPCRQCGYNFIDGDTI
jgi:hypothetical protein